MRGVPPSFRKNPTLRAYKILYSFSANPVTNGNPETHSRIGMYKKVNRVIEKNRRIPCEAENPPVYLATDNDTLC